MTELHIDGSFITSGLVDCVTLSPNSGQTQLARNAQRTLVSALQQMSSGDSIKLSAASLIGDEVIIYHRYPVAVFPASGDTLKPYNTVAGNGLIWNSGDSGIIIWLVKMEANGWIVFAFSAAGNFRSVTP